MRRLACLLVLSGCSFAFVSGPPVNHAQLPYFDCTESRLVPILDTAWTALMALDVVTFLAIDDQQWARQNGCASGQPNCPAISRHGALAIDAVLGIAGAAGMMFGYSRVSACREAKAQRLMRSVPQAQPPVWPPPTPAPVPAPAPAPASPSVTPP